MLRKYGISTLKYPKKIMGGGTAPSPDSSPYGEGGNHIPHSTSHHWLDGAATQTFAPRAAKKPRAATVFTIVKLRERIKTQ